jgi:membrane protein
VFKVIPDVKIRWRDVWIGASVTAVLFSVGKFLIGLYVGKAGVASPYGAAGSLVVIVVWVFYSAHILFIGAEFTQVYARALGSRVEPARGAIAVTEEARAQQGIPHSAPGTPS